jgi:hypothetical protein
MFLEGCCHPEEQRIFFDKQSRYGGERRNFVQLKMGVMLRSSKHGG